MLGNLVTYLASIDRWIESLYVENSGLDDDIAGASRHIVGVSILVLFILMAIAILARDKSEKMKFVLFTMMTTVMVGSTLILATSTIYLNTNSDSNGLTNRQAGIEFWVCGNEINLIDPTGISNKVGTSSVYEQSDNLVHIEGVVVNDSQDGTLGKFMHSFGGAVLDDTLIVPINPDGSIFATNIDGDGPASPYSSEAEKFVELFGGNRYLKAIDNQTCQDQPAKVQVFVYRFDEHNQTYEQVKINRPQDYIFANEKTVPPGDCVIVEFDRLKDKTDKLCPGYGEIDTQVCTEFGVAPENQASCTAHQLNYSPIGTGIDPNIDKELSQ